MSELISSKEAKLAWANGEELQWRKVGGIAWRNINDFFSLGAFDSGRFEFRIKPKTITINGIEVPAPFKPKDEDIVFVINDSYSSGYDSFMWHCDSHRLTWRTEEEIKQVVEALRSIFKQ